MDYNRGIMSDELPVVVRARCRVCGQAIKIDGTDLQRKLRDVERALDDLRKTLEHP